MDIQEPFARAQKEILGEQHSYPMLAFGTMRAPAAWKLYAKSQDIPFEISNAVSDQLKKYAEAVKQADEDTRDEILPEDFIDKQYIEVYNKSKVYQSLVDSWSIAPCGYLLYMGDIRKEIGLVRITNSICCCIDGHVAEANHFLKNDLLVVKVVDLIYKSYARAGISLPGIQELLSMCPPDDPAWKLYANGCTLGLNQVEQKGTSARVGAYKPTNISELCAFVAAIRPGFKSMYKVFSSRQPFSYGIKEFDDLVQTEEMPNSFILYQEQVMAVLHFAGIPLDECYTAIKNIAKKRAEKVMVYKDQFQEGIKKAILNEGGSTTTADKMAVDLWQLIEDSSNYGFNASHAYCVALDSLYSAWIKAHYPVYFYETALRISETKKDKGKLIAYRGEAADYFNVDFEPFRFSQDNREYLAHPETNSMTSKLSSIKGFGDALCGSLYECGQQHYHYFVDVLRWLDERGIKEAKVMPLIKIDYFQDFGNVPTLTRIMSFFNFCKQGTAKKFSRDKLSPEMLEIISPYCSGVNKKGQVLKTLTVVNMDGMLHGVEEKIHELNLPDVDIKTRIQNHLDTLGYIAIKTGKREDKLRLIVTKIYPLMDKAAKAPWAYRLVSQSIGSGKSAALTVYAKVFAQKPVVEGDIIQTDARGIFRNNKGYWYIRYYDLDF